MDTLARLYPGDDALRLAASVAVQTTGVVLIALFASSTFARRNAALRDGIWKAALALVCVAPLAAWSFQHAGIAVWRVPGSGIRENPETVALPSEVSRLPLPAAQPHAPTRSISEKPATLARSASEESPLAQPEPAPVHVKRAPRMNEIIIGAIAGIWALGAVILVVRLLVGVRIVARLRRDLVPFDELPASVIDRLRRTLGVSSLPPIMLSRRIGGPATLGLRRPIVVLPADLAAKMSTDELHDALAHECATLCVTTPASRLSSSSSPRSIGRIHSSPFSIASCPAPAKRSATTWYLRAPRRRITPERSWPCLKLSNQPAAESPSSPCSTPVGTSLPESPEF